MAAMCAHVMSVIRSGREARVTLGVCTPQEANFMYASGLVDMLIADMPECAGQKQLYLLYLRADKIGVLTT